MLIFLLVLLKKKSVLFGQLVLRRKVTSMFFFFFSPGRLLTIVLLYNEFHRVLVRNPQTAFEYSTLVNYGQFEKITTMTRGSITWSYHNRVIIS